MGAWSRLSLFIVLLAQLYLSHSIKLNSDGGYEIMVALDEKDSIPTIGAGSYMDNVKTSLRAFSSKLWVTTKNHFYLKSVDILVPSAWDIDASLSTTSQKNVDFYLSSNITYPHVDNPNVCGRPGNLIRLPSSFFNVTHSGPYGLHWKSLLHVWAMYRFGVHPEHGYIQDSKFPYATWDAQLKQWKVTGCSDQPILGKFINIENPEETTCEAPGVFSNNCRFQPFNTGQNATTSLMHFHWIESITEFCDEKTHNIHAQNKQNVLCEHKSVWEIIRNSPDYLAVASPRNVSVPALTFRILKRSSTPLFYILLDRGLVQGSFSIANDIPRALGSFLTDDALKNTVASVGSFPGNKFSPVIDLVPWSELGRNQNAFLDSVGQLKNDGPLERDFSRALLAAANKIKATSHPNGAVALLIKYGADVKNFGTYLPESDVIHAFNEGNIIFNSIELNFPNHTGYSHLARLSQQTGGTYVTLSQFGEAETSIRNVLNHVKRTLLTEYFELNKNWKTLQRETLTTATIINLSTNTTGPLEVYVSSFKPDLTSSNFSVTGNEYRMGKFLRNLNFRLQKSLDWNEEGSKFTYKLEIPQHQLEGISQISIHFSCGNPSACASDILVRAQSSEDTQVNIDLSTSLDGDVADLSDGRPVSIFAKITKNDRPVQDVTVIATLTETSSLRTTSLRLLDDGTLNPDAQERDGVYSTYFAPENDGQFRLSVKVQGNPSRRRSGTTKLIQSSLARLLPIDQGEDFGCGATLCDSETVGERFVETKELDSTFSITQTSLYNPPPTKILTLMVFDERDSGQITFYWQSPNIPGRLHTVSSYELKSAPSQDLLITNFDNQTEVAIPPNFRPKPPLSLEKVSIRRPAVTTYFAIRSTYRGKKSPVSNIVSINIQDGSTLPTTFPTTASTLTTSPSSTSTTPTPFTRTSTPTPTTPSSTTTTQTSTPTSSDSTTSISTSSTSNPTTPSTGSPTPSSTPTSTPPSSDNVASNVKVIKTTLSALLFLVIYLAF